ncbi:DEAD/DEAH box helicase [Rhizobium yanglingense]
MTGGSPDKSHDCRTLILAPTRELVNQIAENLQEPSCRKSPLRINQSLSAACPSTSSSCSSNSGTDILVATPGRLLDLVNRRAITLTTVRLSRARRSRPDARSRLRA